MPTALHEGPYRFFFYSADGTEPPHVHVECGDGAAKFWLTPVRLAWAVGLRKSELRRIRGIISARQPMLLEAWYEFFGQ